MPYIVFFKIGRSIGFREFLRENEKFRKTVFGCLYVEFFYLKKFRKSRDTVPLNKYCTH